MTERELILGCLNKVASCQRALFQQFAGKMMTVCRRYACDEKEAEDILQESFIRIFTYIEQYKFEGSFEGWIKRIVVNTALKILQNKKIRFSEIDPQDQHTPTVEAEILNRLSAEDLLQLIANLPDGYRLVFNLYALEGYDHNEIASLLGINAGTSRSQLSKARSLLKAQIENFHQPPENYVRKRIRSDLQTPADKPQLPGPGTHLGQDQQ